MVGHRTEGEYETALYLALKPDLVDMSRAVDERSPLPPSFKTDLLAGTHPEGSAARLIPYWSSQTASGVLGDATKATEGKRERSSWRQQRRGLLN